MATKSLRPKARDAALSRLDVAIEVLNVAKEISGIAPIQAALGSLGGLLTVIRDTMASEQGYVELGLSCADICQALDRGTDEKKSEEQKLDKKPDEEKVDEKGLDEKKPAEKEVDEKSPAEKKVDEKKPAKKVDEKKQAEKKPNEKKPDEKKLDESSQAVRATTNKPTKTVAEPKRKVTKQSPRTTSTRTSRITKSEQEEIAAWRAELNRILHVFNTELLDNTNGAASDIRDDVTKIRDEIGGQGRPT